MSEVHRHGEREREKKRRGLYYMRVVKHITKLNSNREQKIGPYQEPRARPLSRYGQFIIITFYILRTESSWRSDSKQRLKLSPDSLLIEFLKVFTNQLAVQCHAKCQHTKYLCTIHSFLSFKPKITEHKPKSKQNRNKWIYYYTFIHSIVYLVLFSTLLHI